MKNHFVIPGIICLMAISLSYAASAQNMLANQQQSLAGQMQTSEVSKIQVAILLDASNSMDGLIDQAKSRLWNIVNTLTTLKYDGKTPGIEIALYMYGNDGLEARTGYIKQITPFTKDLDVVSEKLFSITTNGGSEYCGTVIDQSVKKLQWSDGKENMKLIYIAGNEPFTQGSIPYNEAIANAVGKGIYINTIHCGDCETGIKGYWKDGADKGQGEYFCINSDEKVVYIATPYDSQINLCNEKLNKTYIYYGDYGYTGYANQSKQDMNAQSISSSNITERAVSKSKGVYKNESWDLVDKISTDSTYLNKLEKKSLPKELQDLSNDQLKKEIDTKTAERKAIQKEIAELAKKRQAYIDEQAKTAGVRDDFGEAVNKSMLKVAKVKGYDIINE